MGLRRLLDNSFFMFCNVVDIKFQVDGKNRAEISSNAQLIGRLSVMQKLSKVVGYEVHFNLMNISKLRTVTMTTILYT